MFYEFYIDQFAAEHLLSGFLLLLSASKAAGQNISYKRLLAGDFVGVITMMVLICSGIHGWYFSGMLLSGLTVFCEKDLKRTVRHLLILLFLTLCFGGVLQAMIQISEHSGAIVMTAAGILVYRSICLRKKQEYTDLLCKVYLEWQDRSCRIQALIDTGNSLREPLTGYPVSILAQKEAEILLGNGWEQRKGFYLIPYHSLGAGKSWMRAVTADRMEIEYTGKTIMVDSPVIALYQGKLGKECQMILHCEHVRLQEHS